MTRVRGHYPDLPVCRRERGVHRYRAIETRVAGESSFDLISNDCVISAPVLNPSREDLAAFRKRYGAFDACRSPDATARGEDALYLAFPKPVPGGGRAAPYPASVPACASGASVRRIVMPGAEGIHAFALPPVASTDPADADLASLVDSAQAMGFAGLCQSRLSKRPERHGLFFVLPKDPLGLAGAPDDASLLPEALRACAAPQDRAQEDAEAASLRERVRAITERHRDGEVRRHAAPAAVDRMLARARLALSDEERAFLEDAVAMGLEFGMPTSELIAMAEDLSRDGAAGTSFVAGIAVCLSLGVLRELEWRAGTRGEELAAVDRWTREVETAIRGGRIRIDAESARGSLPSTAAEYFQKTNRMWVGSVVGAGSVFSHFNYLIHEAFHASQDLRRKPLPEGSEERAAYEAGLRAETLLDMATGVMDDPETAELRASLVAYERRRGDRAAEASICLALPAAERARLDEARAEWRWFVDRWRPAFQEEVRGGVPGSARPLLDAFLSRVIFQQQELFWRRQSFVRAGLLHDAGELEDAETVLEEREEELAGLRARLDEANRPLAARATAAEKLLQAHSFYLSHALYCQKDADVRAILADYRKDIPAIAEALWYRSVPNDGVQ